MTSHHTSWVTLHQCFVYLFIFNLFTKLRLQPNPSKLYRTMTAKPHAYKPWNIFTPSSTTYEYMYIVNKYNCKWRHLFFGIAPLNHFVASKCMIHHRVLFFVCFAVYLWYAYWHLRRNYANNCREGVHFTCEFQWLGRSLAMSNIYTYTLSNFAINIDKITLWNASTNIWPFES